MTQEIERAEPHVSSGIDSSPIPVTVLYRVGNPMMQSIAERFQRSRWLDVTNKPISYDVVEIIYKHRDREGRDRYLGDPVRLQELVGDLPGIVVTDYTLRGIVEQMTAHKPLQVYSILEVERDFTSPQRIVGKLGPMVEEIREQGRTPVAVSRSLGDHVWKLEVSKQERVDLLGEESEGSGLGEIYQAVLKRRLGVPAIEGFGIRKELRSLGIDPDKAVILYDHHAFRDGRGLEEFEVYPICPCCLERAFFTGGKKRFPLTRIYDYDVEVTLGELEIAIRDEQKKRSNETSLTPEELAVYRQHRVNFFRFVRDFKDLPVGGRADYGMNSGARFVSDGREEEGKKLVEELLKDHELVLAGYVLLGLGDIEGAEGIVSQQREQHHTDPVLALAIEEIKKRELLELKQKRSFFSRFFNRG